MHFRPLVLAILDGWGLRDDPRGNAIAAAKLPHYHAMLARYPWTSIEASGEAVGLPEGVMGNSEVGHMNLGAGRVVPQGVTVINASIEDGTFAENPTLHACFTHVRNSGGTLHLMGLVSDGCVHSSLEHVDALIEAVEKADVPLAFDAFLDGRDTPPKSALGFLAHVEAQLAKAGRGGAIASVSGRYYAMDRDQRWDRTRRAYDALARGESPLHAPSARAAVEAAYARGETDEFVAPTLVGTPRPVVDGDACIFFDFRPDRARELTLAFSDPGFDHFPVLRYQHLMFATMTKYEEYFTNPVLFGPRPQSQTFGEVVAAAGLRQLRLAETEKYAHVTYFFNGGREEVFPHEDRILIPSDRSVATYDLAPEMRAPEITTTALEDLRERRHDVIVMNYANSDMVGHTGKWDETISACETIDVALGRLEETILDLDGILVVTSDHGNAEEKIDAQGHPLTAHTTSPVPLIIASRRPVGTLAPGGKLGDVAPTLLPLLGLPVPELMTGRNLLIREAAPLPQR